VRIFTAATPWRAPRPSCVATPGCARPRRGAPREVACSRREPACSIGSSSSRATRFPQPESDGELPAGFRVSSADGALVVDATLEKLLDLRRPELAIQVLGRLEERALP
jgi:hypothetical protein